MREGCRLGALGPSNLVAWPKAHSVAQDRCLVRLGTGLARGSRLLFVGVFDDAGVALGPSLCTDFLFRRAICLVAAHYVY